MRTISLDFETFYSDTCSVSDLAPRAYVNHPEFYAYMASASDGEEIWAGDLADFNPESLRGNVVVSHNAAFDRTVAEKVWGPLEELGVVEWNCTANLAACLCGRRSLSDAVHHLFGVQLSKAMRSYMKDRHWRDVKHTPEGAQLLAYAKDDAVWCRKIWTDFLPYWGNFERELSLLTLEASANGVRVDVELLASYMLATTRQLYEIEKKLPWVQTGGKPTSPKAIAVECRKHGIPCPPVKNEDEDLYEEWEATYKDQFEWVLQVGEWRSVNKLLKTLQRLELRTQDDDEMDTPLKYFGAHTGRWSGDNGVNLQNLRKDAPNYGGVDIDMRALFVARPECKLIVADLAQIEPRCLAWCTGDWPFLELVKTGMSPYEAHARISMGWTGGKLKDEAPSLYDLAKARCVAEGTLVATPRGYVPIEEIEVTDQVWDGVEWVHHEGVVCHGIQDTVQLGQERFTEDHEIYGTNEKKQSGAIHEGELAQFLERRFPTGPNWSDLWALARRVFFDVAREWQFSCHRALRRLWEGV